MHAVTRLAVLVLACGLLAACASAPTPPLNDTESRIQVAAQTFGGRFDFLYVPSEGTVSDAAFVTASRLSASQLARDLATRLAPAESQPVRILVTGPAEDKTRQVIVDAFSFHSDGGLPQLEFLFLGDTATASVIEPLVRAKGGSFRHAPY